LAAPDDKAMSAVVRGEGPKGRIMSIFPLAANLTAARDPDAPRAYEADTRQCCHCGSHWVHEVGSGKIRGYCMNCGGHVCGPQCAACVPYERQIEIAEGANPTAVSVGGNLWIP